MTPWEAYQFFCERLGDSSPTTYGQVYFYTKRFSAWWPIKVGAANIMVVADMLRDEGWAVTVNVHEYTINVWAQPEEPIRES